MSAISLRILRAQVSTVLNLPAEPGSPEMRNDLMDMAAELFALHRPAALNFTLIGQITGCRPSTITYCFSDMDGLLCAILLRHLGKVFDATDKAWVQAGPSAARRAYLAATRTVQGAFTRDHRLLLAYATCLAPDQLEEIAREQAHIARLLGGAKALALCDCAPLDLAEIEQILSKTPAAQSIAAAPKSAPAPTPNATRPAQPQAPAPQHRIATAIGRHPGKRDAIPCAHPFLPALAAAPALHPP